MNKHGLVTFFISFSLWTLAGCGETPQPGESAEAAGPTSALVRLSPEQRQNAGIESGLPKRRAMRSTLRVSGMVDVPPQGLVSVSFPLGGYLKSTRLLPGMHVRKGETLAVLEDPQYIQLQQDYLVAKARLEFAEAEFQRQEALQEGQAGAGKAYQQARADLSAQRVLVKALAEKLRLIGLDPDSLDENKLSRSISLPSPINGFISAVHVNIGKYVAPTEVLFELVNPNDIHLNLNVFEKDVPLLRIGQRIRAFTNDRPQEAHPGDIILISRKVGEERAVEVHCHFDRYDPKLFPGMYMNAEVEITLEEALAVPENALVRWENRHFVFAEREQDAFEMLEVEPGVAADGFVQITAMGRTDLEQTRLALSNAYALLMKMKNTGEDE